MYSILMQSFRLFGILHLPSFRCKLYQNYRYIMDQWKANKL